jgi:hypothetical protein
MSSSWTSLPTAPKRLSSFRVGWTFSVASSPKVARSTSDFSLASAKASRSTRVLPPRKRTSSGGIHNRCFRPLLVFPSSIVRVMEPL